MHCIECGQELTPGVQHCPHCIQPPAPREVRFTFHGTLAGWLGWMLLALTCALLIPAPWVVAGFARWFVRNVRLNGEPTAVFRGTGTQIIGWVLLGALVLGANMGMDNGVKGLPLAAVAGSGLVFSGVLAVLALQMLRWFVAQTELSGRPPLLFAGSTAGYVGWSLLFSISIYTIAGWAWALAAQYRWILAKIEAPGLRFVWQGRGHQVLWRSVALFLPFILAAMAIPLFPKGKAVAILVPLLAAGCLLFLWLGLWLTRWFVRQIVLYEETSSA